MFQIIREEMLEREKEIQGNINQLIEKKRSFVFKAGAGAGKTYALIESLRYLLKIEGQYLQRNNQKIAVITFTNVATDEIKERIGSSSLLEISTIHSGLWEIIKRYKKELVSIHLNKLSSKLSVIEESINTDSNVVGLYTDMKEEFINIMLEKSNKDIFYKHHDAPAAPAREIYRKLLSSSNIDPTEILRNIGKFRSLVKNIYLSVKYKQAIEYILEERTGFTEVNYNTKSSYDRLEYMEISHDTLLSYSKRMIESYELLQQIIINKYPYFFVDEYQDTQSEVVEIMRILSSYSQKSKHDFCVGYFGDEAQSIYEYGIGNKLNYYHPDLEVISKELNRRSSQDIINVINRLRNDNMKQKSVYEDASGGEVKFYFGNSNDITSFIENQKKKWEVNLENPLDCLFLTNRSVATNIGISNLYSVISAANLYNSGLGFTRLNEELLSKESEKLGVIQKKISNLFALLSTIESKDRTVNNILLTQSIKKDVTLANINEMIKHLKNIKGDNLGELLNSIDCEYQISGSRFRILINVILEYDEKEEDPIKKFKNDVLLILGKVKITDKTDESQDKVLEKAKGTLKGLLGISKSEYLAWHHYRNSVTAEAVSYHTYHGTKGIEFLNVVIIMENNFGRVSHFDNYFKNRLRKIELEDSILSNHRKAENLLYVATSRAIKNLAIYYIDDIKDFKEGIKDVFGEPNEYPETK